MVTYQDDEEARRQLTTSEQPHHFHSSGQAEAVFCEPFLVAISSLLQRLGKSGSLLSHSVFMTHDKDTSEKISVFTFYPDGK